MTNNKVSNKQILRASNIIRITGSKDNFWRITLGISPIWGINSLTLIVSSQQLKNTIYDSPFTIKPPTQVPFELVRQSYSPTNPKKVCVRGFPLIELIPFREPWEPFKVDQLFLFVYSSSPGQSPSFQVHFSKSSLAFWLSTCLIHLTVTSTVSAGKLLKR